MSGTGATVALGSSNSYDTDGTVVSYYWIQKIVALFTLFKLKKWKYFSYDCIFYYTFPGQTIL